MSGWLSLRLERLHLPTGSWQCSQCQYLCLSEPIHLSDSATRVYSRRKKKLPSATNCQTAALCRLPPGWRLVLRQVAVPGCVQFSRRAFVECCSLSWVGTDNEATNELAPGAQLGPFVFESCLALTSVTFVMDRTNKSRALPDGSFAGPASKVFAFPQIFIFIGPKACENCKRLVEVDLMCTDITAIWGSNFAYCVALVDIWLPPKLQRIGKEAFLCCASLRELVIPTELRYLGIRAFCGCDQLSLFTLLDEADSARVIQAEDNTFLMCDKFARGSWIELLPPRATDSDAFDEELHKGLY